MTKTAIPAILKVLVSQGKKPSDTGIVGIAAIPKTIPKTIPASIRNEKNEKKWYRDTKNHTKKSAIPAIPKV